jgi:hypothetical protein
MSRRLIKVPAKVVIDTGPLILFLAGNYDPERISKMKRVKRRRRTPLQADGASKAPPHESGIMLTGLKTRHVYIV